jgi:hypothetical protein
VRSVFRNIVLLGLIAVAPFSWADRCDVSLVALGSSSEKEAITREALLKDLSSLYLEVLQDKTLVPILDLRVSEMAAIEGQSETELYREIESLADSRGVQSGILEERNEQKKGERSRLWLGLEPFLDRIGRKHRQIIESELIHRDLVNPLSTGEVEFQFRGKHPFLIGDEDFSIQETGPTKEVSFGVGNDFAIGQVPVTQFMYFLAALGEEGVNPTPSHFKEGEGAVVLHLGGKSYEFKPNHPVEEVSYFDAQAHAGRVGKIMKASYGLPTEVQWEFANRAGSPRSYHFGDDVSLLPRYGWFKDNAGTQTHAVGERLPNAFHLYDTHGNVWEWTSSNNDSERVILGGSFLLGAEFLRSANRCDHTQALCDFDLGFRLKRQGASNARPAHTFVLGEPESEATPGSLILGGPR